VRPRIGAATLSIAAAGSSSAVATRRGTTSEAHAGRIALEIERPTPRSEFVEMRRSIRGDSYSPS
jgi:hypothetical protein